MSVDTLNRCHAPTIADGSYVEILMKQSLGTSHVCLASNDLIAYLIRYSRKTDISNIANDIDICTNKSSCCD